MFRVGQRSRSPRRMETKPDASCQTIMTFDNKDETFKLFEEEIHHQTVSSANTFANTKDWVNYTQEDMQEMNNQNPPCHIKEDLIDLMHEMYIPWKYEVTGLTYQGHDNYFIWWMRHPEHKAWYTNIGAKDESHLWIEHTIFWQSAKTMEDMPGVSMHTDLQDLFNALRNQFEWNHNKAHKCIKSYWHSFLVGLRFT